MQEGAWGILQSTYPPISCPAWFSFSTSMSPGKLGMYNFWGMPDRSDTIRYHTYDAIPYPDFWDFFADNGMSCGIINDPLVYAKKEMAGYIVPGHIVPQKEFSTYPPFLRKELDKVVGVYEVDQYAHYLIDDANLIEGCTRIIRKRWEAIRYLVRNHPTDLFLGVITGTDRMFHRFYTDPEVGSQARSAHNEGIVSDYMREVDEGLGDILGLLRPEDMLILISDHGFEIKQKTLNANQLLLDLGMLAVKRKGLLEGVGLTQRNAALWLSRIGLMDKVKRHTPHSIRHLLPKGASRDDAQLIHDVIESGRIDWSKTRMVYLDGFHVNTTDRPEGIVNPDEKAKLLSELENALRSLFSEAGNTIEPFFLTPKEIYPDGIAKNAPALMLDFSRPVFVDSSLRPEADALERSLKPNHAMEGMFLVRHPYVKPGKMDPPLSLLDLAPLILHCKGIQPDLEMQGKVPKSIFLEGSPPYERCLVLQAMYEKTIAEKKRIRAKLNGLRLD